MFFNIFLLSLFSLNALAQKDETFCTNNLKPEDPAKREFPNWGTGLRYTVDLERNSAKDKVSSESREYYDGVRNWGKEIQSYSDYRATIYADFDKDEIISVDEKDDLCLVGKLSELIGLTNFYSTMIGGKTIIVSPLALINYQSQNGNLRFTGFSVTRGIPTKQWQTCVYDSNKQETLLVTISLSNETYWYPPGINTVTYPIFASIPVEMSILHKKANENPYEEIIVLSRFRPTLPENQENYLVPSGYYCKGMKTNKPIPAVPNAFSYWQTNAIEDTGSYDLSGKLYTSRAEHDFDKRLYRMDLYNNGVRYIQIHDYNTGLNYRINSYTESCEIAPLSANNDESQSVEELFKFNEGEEFQYVGIKKVRDMDADVWAAPRMYRNRSSIWEWYFKTDKVDTAKSFRDPVLLLITFKETVMVPGSVLPVTKKTRDFRNIYDFDQARINLYDFDIAYCGDILPKKNIRFTIKNENLYQIMKVNQASVREAITKMVQSTAKVSFLRISRLQAVYDNNTVYVTFTLFDKSGVVGNPNSPVESSLTDAAENLKQAINSDKFVFTFMDSNNQPFGGKADKDSFLDLEKREGQYVLVNVSTGKTIGWSGGSVFGFIFGFLVVGIVIGLVVGILLILKKTNLPGPLNFLNPNFTTRPAA